MAMGDALNLESKEGRTEGQDGNAADPPPDGPSQLSGVEAPRRVRRRAQWRLVHSGRAGGVFAGLVVLVAILAIGQPGFLTWANWENIIETQAVVFALSIGMTLVLLTGGFDLSIASMTAASGMIVGLLMEHGSGSPVGIAAGLGIGLAMGLCNGIAIGVLKIPFFVVTLGALSIYQSVALLMTQGSTISLFGAPNFGMIDHLANGSLGPLPTVGIMLLVIYGVCAVGLHLTPFGRSIYAVGANAEAARLAGLNETLVVVSVYSLSGLFAGLAGVIEVGRLTAAGPQADPNLMLTVIAAVLIGGTAFTGGQGGLLGTVIGVLFLGVIGNAMQLSNVSTFWQGMVSGGILIAAVGLGVLRGRGWGARARQLPRVLRQSR